MANNTTPSASIPFCNYHADSSTEQVFKGIAYFIVTFMSLVGNVLVVSVVAMNRQMRTVTNYFKVNMAVADLLLTVSMAPYMVRVIIERETTWLGGVFGEISCKLIMFVPPLCAACSILSLTAIAVDRFQAVVFPLKRYITLKGSRRIIATVWIAGIAVSSYTFHANRSVLGSNGKWYCIQMYTLTYVIALFVLFFALPLVTMSTLYGFTIHRLWIRKVPGNHSAQNQLRADNAKKKALKMLLTIVCLFALCWMPVYVNLFILHLSRDTFPCGSPRFLIFLGLFLPNGSSAFNPAIYAAYNEAFRRKFIEQIAICRRCKQKFPEANSKYRSRNKVDFLPSEEARNTIPVVSLVSVRKLNGASH